MTKKEAIRVAVELLGEDARALRLNRRSPMQRFFMGSPSKNLAYFGPTWESCANLIRLKQAIVAQGLEP